MQATVIMPPVDEHDTEGSLHSRGGSQASMYPVEPFSPHDMPLLQQSDSSRDDTVDVSTHNLMPPTNGDSIAMRSVDTLDSSEDLSSSQRLNPPSGLDPRGEAPPYFESVPPGEPDASQYDAGNGAQGIPTTTPELTTSSSADESPIAPVHERRRSGFRTFLHALSNPMGGTTVRPPIPPTPQEPQGPRHTRANSGLSVVSSDASHAREGSRSRSRLSHRPSQSGSGSMLNTPSAFRTISRQRSTNTLNSNHLNSPSLISLNSISSPLTHTLVRSEFTYPKSGPTPEQLKLISSRESFARFGMPYGADAIAYAASTSRQELDPPPDFDAPSSSGFPRTETGSSSATQHSDSPLSPLAETDAVPENAEASPSPIPTQSTGDNSSSAVTQSSGAAAASKDPPQLVVPPTSFKSPLNPIRSESRASSMRSYATAAESLLPSGDGLEPESESPHHPEPQSPSTPKVTSGVVGEAPEPTLTQEAMLITGQAM